MRSHPFIRCRDAHEKYVPGDHIRHIDGTGPTWKVVVATKRGVYVKQVSLWDTLVFWVRIPYYALLKKIRAWNAWRDARNVVGHEMYRRPN